MKKKRKRPGTPREGFVMPLKGKRVSLGTVPATPERALDPEMEEIISEYLPLLKGNRAHRIMKLKLIQLTAPGPGQMSGTAAYHSLNPNIKRSSCASTACRYMREIEAEIGIEGKHALQGVHIRRIDRILSDASGAMFTRQFLDMKTKTVISAPPLEDHALRLRSAELMMKVLSIGREKEDPGHLVVNIVQYNPPGTPVWPGGGREGAVFPSTPVRAALPAASPPPDDFTGEKGVRDD